ncbi:hypothetical protein TBLA_0C03320 [Henningerozyma blattae CBS 6284]|uniref:HDA1 complex subunit 2 n=1 Tax=Henningerozyma blattae (strain ATCC 34711 / CBS 6284 / DSM 70876 / NBRC 10599 / NRRL Y-10934 / UCD 77-7) TaxID=1071380 RepID=I2H183_HENB6|nr:hypothetical protein TBLA_0C03320 [Tetrapisispora blattae CBS 6284]CCH60135.1 hypothetical protein TBLA_0C03320 [Tetrapisispora blattae CBS 6284]
MMKRKHRNYTIPVGMTTFQKDLVEILVSLHAKSLSEEIAKWVSNSMLEASSNSDVFPNVSTRQMTYILDDAIRAIGNHPCLLVHHYMPRQVLLMEPSERLFSTSDKLQNLSDFIHSIILRDRSSYPKTSPCASPLKIALISHNIREVDILEGFLLGKPIKLKRFVGTSLYDEKHVYIQNENKGSLSHMNQNSTNNEDDVPISRSTSNSSKSSTPVADSSSNTNSHSHPHKDNYEYSKRRKRQRLIENSKQNEEDWIFLTSTRHLNNNPNLLLMHDVDIIISCDPLIDSNHPAITTSRNSFNKSKSSSKDIPFIKFLVQDSPDHYIIKNHLDKAANKNSNNINNDDDYCNILSSLCHFLTARKNIIETKNNDTHTIDYKKFTKNLLSKSAEEYILPECHLSTGFQNDNIELLNECLIPSISNLHQTTNPDSNLKFDIKDIKNMNEYQLELTKKTIELMDYVQNEVSKKSLEIEYKRLKETERQDQLDELKKNIGTLFKKTQDQEKLINDSNKSLTHATSESSKLDQELNFLKNNINKLESLLAIDDNDYTALNMLMSQYSKENNKLLDEKLSLDNKVQEINTSNDELRSKYQLTSKHALDLATTLKEVQKKHSILKNESSGPLGTTELMSLENEKQRLKDEIFRLEEQEKFMNDYASIMEKHYKFNEGLNDSSKNFNSSNNSLGNGRNPIKRVRHRSTRSNTPSYT